MSIILTNLTKRYDANVVVNDVSLEVNDGELFVLLGGSGSGKSTILRLIAGLIEPENGRIELNGRDVTYLPPQERGTGFVFQNYSIFRHMTVAQNVEFGLQIRRISPDKRRERSAELLELVGLAGLGGRYADQLSGGQQQRVALARALAYEPAVLLLDEPFGALDVKIRAQLRKSLREIQRKLQVTTILVTHDQEEAFELADRIGVPSRPASARVSQRMKFCKIFVNTTTNWWCWDAASP
jgi:sulfate/thiosulfate transport system ATP-binding protein